MTQSHVTLAGTGRRMRPDAKRVADVDPSTPIEVTVTLPGPDLPEPTETLSREELEQSYSPSAAQVDSVVQTLQALGLTVKEASALTRSVKVEGTAAKMEEVFRPGLGIYENAAQGRFRGREGEIHVVPQLEGKITGVLGFDERRVARRATQAAAAAQATPPALGPADLEAHYDFPAGDAAGQRVAIGEFGGGYFAEDLDAFCQAQQRQVPNVEAVAVGAPALSLQQILQLPKPQRNQQLGISVEVMMDVEIVAGLCPGADIVVYFAPFTQRGWVDMINRLITDPPAVALSLSWGLPEDSGDFSVSALQAIDLRFRQAALLGITACVAAGDDGSGDQMDDGRAHVNFPASSPNVLAVGGTELDGNREVVWWDAPGRRTPNGGGSTGGGVSVVFPRPSWQSTHVASLNPGAIDGRIVPDIAALAGEPLYDLIFLGRPMPNGGTSASAPLWASLLARIRQAQGPGHPAKFLAPLLYTSGGSNGHPRGAQAMRDVTVGHNTSTPPGKGYTAGVGFDAVSGWGVPDGKKLLAVLP
jgi:kumamolisin